MTAARRLRELLRADGLIVAPGVYDGISATLVGRLGFQAAYMTGAGVSAAAQGLPDIGLLTQTEMSERARVLCGILEIPLIADADTGYGSPVNVVRTVREYERAGVAAIQLEDQVSPKRCGHLTGKEVVDAADFEVVLQAAREARRDADTVIVARTDARAPLGLDEAIARARRYAAAGADVIFVEAPQSEREIEAIAAAVDAPLLINIVPGGLTPDARQRAPGRAGLPHRDPPGRRGLREHDSGPSRPSAGCASPRPRSAAVPTPWRSSSCSASANGASSATATAPTMTQTPSDAMPASEVTIVDAGGRDVRVSNPQRVIFPATERSQPVTKLDIVEYYLAVDDGIMRALARRPTTLERWPKGVHPGIVLSTREKGGGDAFFQKRIPRGAPDYVQTATIKFPSGRTADEVCPTEIAVVAWAAQMGTITFHPWPVRREDLDHPDELRLDLDPQPGTDFADAVLVAAEARVLLEELGCAGFPKTSGGRGIHIYVRIEPRWTFTDVRHAAIAFGRELERRLPGRVTTNWWKEERGERIFVDYNQNARDRTIASAYSVRPKPGAPVSAPLAWEELEDVAPEDFTVATMPARFAEVGDRHAAIDDASYSLEPLLDMYERDLAEGREDMPYPPDYPKMPGEPKRVQPSRDRDRPRS